MAFLGAEMRMGIAVVMEALRFDDYLRDADLVITGEGKVDQQVMHGKVLSGVGGAARRHGVPVIAFAGQVTEEPEALEPIGLAACVPICPSPAAESDCIARAAELLQQAVERTVRLVLIGEELGSRRGGA
jgi:glycerate kinase